MKKYPLEGSKVYLSGPIQYDIKEDWRNEPRRVLVEEFKINLFDPFADPKQQWVPVLEEAQKNQDLDTIVKISKSFVRKDLCMVDRADFVIAYLPYKVPTTGTHHEIINSNNAKKPTLLVTDQPKITSIPLWYFGFIPKEFMFAGWNELFEYLREVNSGNHRKNNRWSYIYADI
jgi:nucleoside 2-deoxyribosyltransferase